jgi:hypothetical protein
MTEQELRALVREAIARHAGIAGTAAAAGPAAAPIASVRQHASHALFLIPSGAETDGPCLIEPSVPCTHCGYCKSYGH